MGFQAEAQFVEHRVAGFVEITDLTLVGLFDVGTDEHEFLDAAVVKRLSDRLRGGNGMAAAGLLDDINDGGLVGQAIFHGVRRAMKDNHSRFHVRDCLRRLGKGSLEFTERLAKLSRHAQTRDMNAHVRRHVGIELWFG